MILLLDSHALLWFVSNDLRLSSAAKNAIEAPINRKLISIATLWEITIKVSIGKLILADPVDLFLSRELQINKFNMLIITIDQLATLSQLPFHHR